MVFLPQCSGDEVLLRLKVATQNKLVGPSRSRTTNVTKMECFEVGWNVLAAFQPCEMQMFSDLVGQLLICVYNQLCHTMYTGV